MRIPPIDLTEIVAILKKEGKTEIASAPVQPKLGAMTKQKSLLSEWGNIINVLENELVPLLAKGGDVSKLVAPAGKLAKSAGTLASMASQALSFVPGPIGIVCSVINAIVCFSSGNVIGGLLELLGCIPGGKVGAKAGAKLAPKIEKALISMIQKNPVLRKYVADSLKVTGEVKAFFGKCSRNLKEQTTPRKKLDIQERSYYLGGTKSNNYKGLSPQSLHEGNQFVQRTTILPKPVTNVGNPYSNIYSHLWQ